MRADDALKLSTRMFKTNPARTWLTILGMGVGTSAVVMLVGLGFGLQNILIEKIVFGDTLLSLNVTNPPTHAVVLDDAALAEFRQIPKVNDVAPLVTLPALITLDGVSANLDLQGAGPAYFKYAGVQIAAGEQFKSADEKGTVILSSAALKLFGIDDPKSALGKSVHFRVFVPKGNSGENEEVSVNGDFTVKGVTSDAAAIYAMMPLGVLSSQFAVTQYDRVQVRAESSGDLNNIQNAILGKGFVVTALSKTVEQANQIFQGIQWILAGFGGIALVVSAIGMFNTMTVTLLERTSEIGVMRTLGASPGDIRILFLSEAMVVGFLGGITGMGIGVIIGLIVNYLLNLVATHYGGTAVSLFSFPATFLGFIAVFSAIVGFLTGVFPARRAANISPLEAIRYK